MPTIKQALQNLKNNGPGYYPCLVGGKLHINKDGNWYRLIRNDSHEVICEWDKNTGIRIRHANYKTLLPVKQA